MQIVYTVVLPVFLIFMLGFVGQRIYKLHIKSISTTAIYLMAPVLVFRTFYRFTPDQSYLHIAAYGIVLSLLIILLVKIIARIKGYDESVTNALILGTAFMNNGNLGAPLVLFAFGETAFMYAISIMVFHTVIMSTLGIYYAARGKADVRESLLTVAKMPILHALIIAVLWQYLHIPMPDNIYKAVDMVAQASIILIMLVMGMQLAEIRLESPEWGKISLAVVIRLLVSPLIALLFTAIVAVDPLLGKVMILEAAMPTATLTTMYALQFNVLPNLVTSISF
ncbi:MAG: AEC family transporter, partial [Bacillota bacterium]